MTDLSSRHGNPAAMTNLFLTTTALVDCAAEWLDLTMSTLLNIYGLQKCVRVFGAIAANIPREETKVCPESFILDFISTLHIGKTLNREIEGARKGRHRIIE